MKTPRAALLAALFSAAVAAQAKTDATPPTTSLNGWMAYKAFTVENPLAPSPGKAYAEGVVYCDVGTPQAPKFPASSLPFMPAFDCVVVGKAQTKVPAKVGGVFFKGKAWEQVDTRTAVSMPNSGHSYLMLLRIDEKRPPLASPTVMLIADSRAEESQFTSFVEGGYHLSEVPYRPAEGKPAGAFNCDGKLCWCDHATGKVVGSLAKNAKRSWILVSSPNFKCIKNTGTPGVVTAPETPKKDVVAADSLALINPAETRWLTKVQAAAYSEKRAGLKDAAAIKDLDGKLRRDTVAKQIRPEVKSAYESAYASAEDAPKKIETAIGKTEMWGGEVSAVVAPFQEKADAATAKLLEIQLSKADWDALKKKPDDFKAYTASRHAANGASGDGTAFNKDYLDPVALHLGVEAARKATGTGGTTPVVGAKPEEGAALVALLKDDEKKLLTPDELKNYESIYKSAPDPKEKDKNLQAEAKRLRDLIASEGRGKPPVYAKPGDRAAFDKLQDWQKRKFCSELVATTAGLAEDKRGAEVINGKDAKAGLKATDASGTVTGNTTTTGDASASDWTADACKPYKAAPVVTTPGKTGTTAKTDVPTPVGTTVENKEKKNEWVTQDLLVSAAKGGMVGLLVGSLFGPVGLIAGPLIGAALFYGLTKITS